MFTGAEEYERSFAPRDYLREYYRLSDGQGRPNAFLTQNLRSLAKVFALGETRDGDDAGLSPGSGTVPGTERVIRWVYAHAWLL